MEQFEEYTLDDEDIPAEILNVSQQLANMLTVHRVYFEKDTGEVIAITNEDFPGHDTFFEIKSVDVDELLRNNKRLMDYCVTIDTDGKPILVLKNSKDEKILFLKPIDEVDHWNYELTIEKYPLLRKWGFHLRPDKKIKLKNIGINITLEFFIVNDLNHGIILRTINLNLNELYGADRLFIPFELDSEDNEDLKIYTKSFLKTYGFKMLYDTDN